MKLNRILIVWLSLCALASAESLTVGELEISSAWARASAPGAPSAGFLLIANHGTVADTLLGVSGAFAKRLEVHQSKMVDGVMKMEHQVNGVVIPAGGSVAFEPGGYHLMFMGLNKNFEAGENYSVRLNFARAGEIELTLPVRAAAPSAMH